MLRLLAFLVSLLCGVSNAVAQQRGSVIGLVPRDAVAVAKLNWNVVRVDEQFRSMLNADQLDRALGNLNIRGSQISEVVIFSDVNASPSGLMGGIFEGTYDVGAVRAALESSTVKRSTYLGRIVYCGADKSCSSLLKSGRLLVGSQKAVESVIDVELNPRTGLIIRKPFSTMLRKFVAGRQPISFAMALPLEYQMVAEVGVKVVAALFNFSGLGPLGFVIDKIGLPQAIGFAITRNGNTFPTELIAKMKDEQSAALVSGTLSLAQSINLTMLANRRPAADTEMLKNLSVTRKGSLLSIRMILSKQDLAGPRR